MFEPSFAGSDEGMSPLGVAGCAWAAFCCEDWYVVIHVASFRRGLPVIEVLLAKVLRRMSCPLVGLEPGIGTVSRRLPPCGVSHLVVWRSARLSLRCVSDWFLDNAQS